MFSLLGPDQIINHLPGERAVVDKGPLTRNLERHAAADPGRRAALDGFYPETYCLADPEDRERFFARVPEEDDPERLWILKPDRGSEGRGIRVLWQLDLLRRWHESSGPKPWDTEGDAVIQRYVANPLLVDGRKSALRVFVLVASVEPLLVLVYRDGFVRINSVPYRLDDLDPVVHLTNTRQQRDHPDFDPSSQVWTFPQLQAHLAPQLGTEQPDFFEHRFFPAVHAAVSFVFRAARDSLRVPASRGHCFGLYGVDLLLDDALRPWVLEVQVNPGLKHRDPAKARIVPPLLVETVRVAREVRDRSRSGRSLAQLDGLDRYRWAVNEAAGAS